MTTKKEETKVLEEKEEKEVAPAKTVASAKEETAKKKEQTICMLSSKANYIVPITCNGKKQFIQPFGKIKVVKETVKFDKNDAKYLTFIKL